MAKRSYEPEHLPAVVAEHIELIIKKMRYRRKVRQEVRTELAGHFADALRDYENEYEKEKLAERLTGEFGDEKLLATLIRRGKKRCRPLWVQGLVRTCQALGVLILALTLYMIWFWSGKPVISINYVARLNEIARAGAEENLNAAPLYDNVTELYVEPTFDTYMNGRWVTELNDEELSTLRDWIWKNEATLEKFKLASEKPYYWRRYQSETGEMLRVLLPTVNKYKRVVRLVLWRARIRVLDGEVKEALDDILACYRAGMHMRTPTFLIEQLVAIAVESETIRTVLRILTEVEIEAEVLADFHGRFEKLVEKNRFGLRFDGEELSWLDEVQRSFTAGTGGGHVIPKRLRTIYDFMNFPVVLVDVDDGSSIQPKRARPNWFKRRVVDAREMVDLAVVVSKTIGGLVKKTCSILFFHPDKGDTTEKLEELFDYFELVAAKTPFELRQDQIESYDVVESMIKGNIFLEVVLANSGAIRVIDLSWRSKAQAEGCIATIGALRYKQEMGDFPNRLEYLIEVGLLKRLPMDPYSDKPLVYRKTNEGFTLYSVGENFTDDGGKMFMDDKGIVKMWAEDGDTVFWPVH